jgi:hypothetical protein
VPGVLAVVVLLVELDATVTVTEEFVLPTEFCAVRV